MQIQIRLTDTLIPYARNARTHSDEQMFSGSGSQLIAGEKTGRVVYGLELSPQFCDVSKHFVREIRTAKPRANAMVAESLFNEAVKGKGHQKVTAAIFWLKCQAGWKDTQHHELSSPSDRPMRTLNEFYGKKRKS